MCVFVCVCVCVCVNQGGANTYRLVILHAQPGELMIKNEKLGQSDLVYRGIGHVLPAERHCPWAACFFISPN